MDWEITNPVHLEIDGIPLATPAWEITNLAPLLDAPEMAGQNRRLAGGGVIANPRSPTETRRLLPIQIRGMHDPEGTEYEDPFVGLEINTELLTAVIADGDAVLTGRLYLPSGAVKAGRVQIVAPLGLNPGGWYVLNGVIDLLLIDGTLDNEES